MPGGDEPGKREELVKRNTRQLYLMFFVFAIIIAAYSCRLLAWFDIGGNYPSIRTSIKRRQCSTGF